MGRVVIVYFAGELLSCEGLAQVPKMHQVCGQVVLLAFRHACQLFLNLFDRHTQKTLGAVLQKSKKSAARANADILKAAHQKLKLGKQHSKEQKLGKQKAESTRANAEKLKG